jgi:hypothetical protein
MQGAVFCDSTSLGKVEVASPFADILDLGMVSVSAVEIPPGVGR